VSEEVSIEFLLGLVKKINEEETLDRKTLEAIRDIESRRFSPNLKRFPELKEILVECWTSKDREQGRPSSILIRFRPQKRPS